MSRLKYLDLPNLVVLAGRTNVGKSALFNRVIGEHKALVAKETHLTRDLNIGRTFWRGVVLSFADTGGADLEQKNNIDDSVWEKVGHALESAKIIVFVTDIHQGVSPFERKWIKDLQKLEKPIIIAANKADSARLAAQAAEFYKLGIKDVLPVSALTGAGAGDLLDAIVKAAAAEPEKDSEEKEILKLAIVGKTNVGKSSLTNRLIGENRMIVSQTPHTTREPIDSHLKYEGRTVILVDTAGLRRRAKMATETERIGATRTWRAIKRSDVILFMFDASSEISAQDQRIAGMIKDSKKPLIVLANKWDLIPDKTEKTMEKFQKFFIRHFPFLKWAPIIFISAKTEIRTREIFKKSFEIIANAKKTVDEKELSKYLRAKLPPQDKTPLKLSGAKQISVSPPAFELKIKTKKKLPGAFYGYMENRIRERFGFEGTPIDITMDPQ